MALVWGARAVKKICDKCNHPATVHEVEIVKGQKIEKHLCDDHAREEGIAVGADYKPINELLTNFVKMHSGSAPAHDLVCDNCGMGFSEFRENSLLGCPQCYIAFEAPLSPLLERAQDNGTHHIGKVPQRCGIGERRQEQLLRMRNRLAEAVKSEDFELAARLRDDISQFEGVVE